MNAASSSDGSSELVGEKYAVLVERAEPFAVCTIGWAQMGYGGVYTCLDREVDIAKPDHPTRDWWPVKGPCNGCELARVLGRTGTGTLTCEEREQQRREEHDRREFARLSAKFAPPRDGRPT